ncbi:hypothetical protein [Achromobacter sp. K91]|uniref:hypothetical protein n=1 Tax=Achromobacter sp. K91 TaxID=2292262 RepID=UPI0011C36B29|nr:hypothetical protein [Achromobacter sp. K91]
MFHDFMTLSQTAAAWASAIGTTFAACVALWLGLAETRRREEIRQADAKVLRLMAAPELHSIDVALSFFPRALNEIVQTAGMADYKHLHIDALHTIAAKLHTPVLDRGFDKISSLEADETVVVSLLCGEIPRLRLALEDWIARYDTLDSFVTLASNCKERTSDIRELIRQLPFVDY